MPRRKPPPEPVAVVGLARRGRRAYYHRTMPAAVGGDRVFRSLEADWGSDAAGARAAAIGTLWDRGDWPILRRWAAGEIHVSEIQRAVRSGDWARLNRLNSDGYLLGRAVKEHMARTENAKRPSTVRNHAVVTDALVERFGPDRAMHTIGRADAEAFLHDEGRGWSLNTQKLYRMVAGALWHGTMEREVEEAEAINAAPSIVRNPWRQAKLREDRIYRPSVLTAEERDDLLDHPDVVGTPARALIALAYLAGLRQQEACQLRTTVDVDLWERWTAIQAGEIHVQSRKGDRPWDTKTVGSDRRVPIVPRLGRILADHIARGYAGRSYLLRPARADRPISNDTAERWTRTAYGAAGIKYGRNEGEGITLHAGRHTAASLLLSGGASIAVVAEFLGDTQATVLKTYSHCLPRDRDLVLTILEGA